MIDPERVEQIDDYDAIVKVLRLYLEGSARGEPDKLKEAFHPDSRMFGSLGGKRVDVPIQALFEMTAEGPADIDGAYRGRVVSVTQVGDAATAMVAEDGFWGRCRLSISSASRRSTAGGGS